MFDAVKAVMKLNERRWPEMWGYVQRAHRILKETASKPSDHSDLRAEAMTFFILSLHLADWIAKDDSNDITEDQIARDMGGSHIMSVANNFANTSKHYGRDPGKGDDVRIDEVVVEKRSAGHSTTSATIKYERNRKHQTKDIVALADECLGWWKGYLKKHDLLTDEHLRGN
jgi:hypothetical protein